MRLRRYGAVFRRVPDSAAGRQICERCRHRIRKLADRKLHGLQSIGEALMISGLGLAMVAQLVPQRLMGFIMGSWFLTTAGANIIGGYVANLMAVPSDVTDP